MVSIRGLSQARLADRPFYTLAGLVAALLTGLIGAIVGILPAYREALLKACRETWTATMGILSPWSLIPIVTLLLILGGTAVVLVRHWLRTQRLLQTLLESGIPLPPALVAVATELGIAAKVDLVDEERIYSFCYGLRSPRICLSTRLLELLDKDELRALLLHERHHLESHDPLKVILSRAFSGGLFFLPLARDLRDSYLMAKEIDADERTAAEVKSEIPLAKALLKMLKSGQELQLEKLAAIGAFNATEERVKRLIGQRTPSLPKPSLGRLVASALIVGFILGASYGPAQASPASAAALSHDECVTQSAAIDQAPFYGPNCVAAKNCVPDK